MRASVSGLMALLVLWFLSIKYIHSFIHAQLSGYCSSSVDVNKTLTHFYRAMLCIRGTSHGPVSVSVCVCLSVTSRSSTKTAKRRITQTTPHEDSSLMPNISTKFDRGHPLRGRRMQVGWVKIGDFRQISGYISKTVTCIRCDKMTSFH